MFGMCGGAHLWFSYFGRLRQEDQLNTGVEDQPGQHETHSKKQTTKHEKQPIKVRGTNSHLPTIYVFAKLVLL